jgi:GNAT superfamily N-acetyltransferase
MTPRQYPDDPAGPFPTPPDRFTDSEKRSIDIERFDDELTPLIEMYDAFDPADRAQGIPPTGRTQVREWLESLVEDGLNLVAWHDDQAVGHALLVPDRGNDAWELAIFVDQSYQGAGVGSRLIRLLLGAAAEDGIERVWLSVERWNHPAIGLYESVGFERASTESFELSFSIRLE